MEGYQPVSLGQGVSTMEGYQPVSLGQGVLHSLTMGGIHGWDPWVEEILWVIIWVRM